MKKIIVTFILISFLLSTSYSQSGWFWQNPLPQGNILECVQYLPGGIAYSVGRVGIVLKSTNDGLNWTILNYPSRQNLKCVFFLNPNTGWVSGYPKGSDKNVYYTSDGGNIWVSRFVKDTVMAVDCVKFINGSTGFAGGDYELYKTTNGGINWTLCYSTNTFFSSIFFIDSQTVYASVCSGQYNGKIVKTTNGGSSWQAVSFGYPIYHVYFLNSQTGFAVGTLNVLRTMNGGISWDVVYTVPQYSILMSIAKSNSMSIFVCGGGAEYADGIVIKSTNGGSVWGSIALGRNLRLNSISFVDNLSGLTAGVWGTIFKTSDGGSDWNRISYGNLNNLNSICFLNSSTGCAVGDSGVIVRTTNAGNNWYMMNNPGSLDLYAVKFTGSQTGYAAGAISSGGIIYKTTSAGQNWFLLSSGEFAGVAAMSWINDNSGYAACGNGQVIKTTNGGINWTAFSTGLTSIQSICFTDINTGYIVKGSPQTGSVSKTTNGGLNWFSLSPHGSRIYFTNPATGYLTDDFGVYKTINSGQSWNYVSIPSNIYTFKSIDFINENTGFICGMLGVLYKTTNSGQSWLEQFSGTKNYLFAIDCIDENTSYIAGEFGTILKTTTGGEPMSIKPILSEVPNHFSLSQNYPNPFNPITKIKFDIPPSKGARGMINTKLIIYDVLGREIAVLVNEQLSSGTYEVVWDGSEYPSEVYFYKLITNEFSETKKMVLIK
jgi:photosystem II stability/assembly factor-like uncharacterized protein